MTATPFAVQISDDAFEQLRQKLDLTRWPDELEGAEWNYGVPLSEVKRLAHHWRNSFDWSKHEDQINDTLPQFSTSVAVEGFGELNIHFVHKRSSRENAIPLLFQHGWPGSFLEVSKILPLLTEPEEGPAFHVVAPSMAGYGFSEAPRKPGFNVPQHAEVAHKLMLQLGYTQYVTQGGDWGSAITRVMGLMYAPDHCKGSHFNMLFAPKPTLTSSPALWLRGILSSPSAAEKVRIARSQAFWASGSGYAEIQGTRPQTLGYGLADSPVGLLAWIYEKLHEWSDAYPWTDDEILTWVSIYWFSRAGPTASFRPYFEAKKVGALKPVKSSKSLLLGMSYFPGEIVQTPSLSAKAAGNLVFENTHEKGGHFAAHEAPEALAGDLRKMFGRGGPAFGAVSGADGYEKEAKSEA